MLLLIVFCYQSSALWVIPNSSAIVKNAFLEFLIDVSDTQNARRQYPGRAKLDPLTKRRLCLAQIAVNSSSVNPLGVFMKM